MKYLYWEMKSHPKITLKIWFHILGILSSAKILRIFPIEWLLDCRTKGGYCKTQSSGKKQIWNQSVWRIICLRLANSSSIWLKLIRKNISSLRTPYVNRDAQRQGRVPRHRELDPDKLYSARFIHMFQAMGNICRTIGMQMWFLRLWQGIHLWVKGWNILHYFQKILFTYQFSWRLKRVTCYLIHLWGTEQSDASLMHIDAFLWDTISNSIRVTTWLP